MRLVHIMFQLNTKTHFHLHLYINGGICEGLIFLHTLWPRYGRDFSIPLPLDFNLGQLVDYFIALVKISIINYKNTTVTGCFLQSSEDCSSFIFKLKKHYKNNNYQFLANGAVFRIQSKRFFQIPLGVAVIAKHPFRQTHPK